MGFLKAKAVDATTGTLWKKIIYGLGNCKDGKFHGIFTKRIDKLLKQSYYVGVLAVANDCFYNAVSSRKLI